MLGLGVSLLRSNRPLGELTAKLAYDLGDKTANGGIIYYTVPPNLNETSTTSFEALPYSLKFPKDSQDNFYDYNSSEELVYTIPSTRILDATNNFSNIYEGRVKDNWVVLRRDNQTFTEISDDDKLIGWFNYVYSENKDNFDKGLYFFPNEVNSVNQTKGAVFSTDTELFYDNIDISKLNVHVCVSAAVTNNFTNVFPTPLEAPLVTPTEFPLSVSPNELLATGLSVPEVAKQYRYNQRYHKYVDYKDEITFADTLSTNDTNKEFRPTNNVCLSQLNKKIIIQVPQYRFNKTAPYPWRRSEKITMTGEIACLGPYAFEAPAGVVYQPFEVDEITPEFAKDLSYSTSYGQYNLSIRIFEIDESIIDNIFIQALGRTVAQATYTLNSEDGDGTHKLLYFKVKNIRFKSKGYLPSRNTLSTSMTESILVPTVASDLVADISSYANLVVASFNQTSLKSTNQLNPLVLSSNTNNFGELYNISEENPPRFPLKDIMTTTPLTYQVSTGTISGDERYLYVGAGSRQIDYRVKGKMYSWASYTTETFINLRIRLIKINVITGDTTVLEETNLLPSDMTLVEASKPEDNYYQLDFSSTSTYLPSLASRAFYVDLRLTIIPGFQFLYDTNEVGDIVFDIETKFTGQLYPLSPTSPPPAYNIPTIPTYNE